MSLRLIPLLLLSVACLPAPTKDAGAGDDTSQPGDGGDDGGSTDCEEPATWYRDEDGDGYGRNDDTVDACEAPTGYVEDDTDCNDSDDQVHPGADEICNGEIDDDCDASTLESDAVDADTFYQDSDGDGFGDPESSTRDCAAPDGFVDNDADCDDTNDAVAPDQPERCSGVDDDCDGSIDEDDATDATTWYLDDDGDDFGTADAPTTTCDQPTGYVANADDCDDGDVSVNPDQDEVCDDGLDNDCDASTTCVLSGEDSLGDADWRWVGESTDDQLGWIVAPVGDVDADGFADVLIGAPGKETSSGDSSGGGFYLIRGSSGASGTVSGADTFALGSNTENGRMGTGLAGAGDVDNDGYLDMLLGVPGAPLYDENPGRAYVIRGPLSASSSDSPLNRTSQYFGEQDDSTAGDVVNTANLDGDGYLDLIVSATAEVGDDGENRGSVYLVWGPLTSDTELASADVILRGDGEDTLGWDTRGCDTDGDGTDELFLGAPFDSASAENAGGVYMLQDPAEGDYTAASVADAAILGDVSGDFLGVHLACAGDWNGDGNTDLAVSASEARGGGSLSGIAFVFAGPVSGTLSPAADAVYTVEGAASGDSMGAGLDAGGDFDGDGNPDLLLAAPKADDGSSADAGLSYVFFGPLSGTDSASDADYTLVGEAEAHLAGTSARFAGDVDGNGTDDLLIGAPGYGTSVGDRGAAYVVLGYGL